MVHWWACKIIYHDITIELAYFRGLGHNIGTYDTTSLNTDSILPVKRGKYFGYHEDSSLKEMSLAESELAAHYCYPRSNSNATTNLKVNKSAVPHPIFSHP